MAKRAKKGKTVGTEESWRERIHVVLVEPGDNLNIGSVARAMMNLGFRNLHLVAPPRYDFKKARITACWAHPILEKAHLHATLEGALHAMREVVGFSTRGGKNRGAHKLLHEWVKMASTAPVEHTALVFGPEDNGLRQEHIELCRWFVRIPSTEEYPAYNLADSVLLALYEMSRVEQQRQSGEKLESATWNEYAQLDTLIEHVGNLSGFIRKGTPAPVPGVLKNLMRRVQADKREMGILLGLFGRVKRTLDKKTD